MSLLHLDLPQLVAALGYAGLFFIIFAESGLFFGFFFPGDSLLFTAGLLASGGIFNPGLLVLCVAFAAIAGDSVGYSFGAYVGPRLFTREDSFFFHKRHIDRTRAFYEKYGPQAVILARFVPIVRTFAPILAGVGGMRYRTFLAFNIIGGLLWSIGVLSLGFFLGAAFPGLQHYLLPITLLIVLLSIVPLAREYFVQR